MGFYGDSDLFIISPRSRWLEGARDGEKDRSPGRKEYPRLVFVLVFLLVPVPVYVYVVCESYLELIRHGVLGDGWLDVDL